MTHPCVIKPDEHAVYAADRMGKTTIFESPSLLVGLNAFTGCTRTRDRTRPIW